MNQILLVAGSPRSGTTFIASTLNAHPQICLFSEFSLTNMYRSLDQMVGFARPPEIGSDNRQSPHQFTRPSADDHDDLFRSIFRYIYPTKHPSILGAKMPALATKEDVDYLLVRQPRLKFIYILRNCVATVASSMRRYVATLQGKDSWLYENETQALHEWVYSLLIGRYLAEHADVLFVKYEDLVSDPAQFDRISDFIGIAKIRFDVALSRHQPARLCEALAVYPEDLSKLVHDWGSLSGDEIAQRALDAVRNHMAAAWQQMGIALCDIGTHINFNRPEPWGAWSQPGFLAIKPRFIRIDRRLAHVDIEIREKCERVEHANIRAAIGHRAVPSTLIAQSPNTTLVRITSPTLGNARERPVISLFFDRWVRSERDPRSLGLPLTRYRLEWDENGT